jgi:hypothetical protein
MIIRADCFKVAISCSCERRSRLGAAMFVIVLQEHSRSPRSETILLFSKMRTRTRRDLPQPSGAYIWDPMCEPTKASDLGFAERMARVLPGYRLTYPRNLEIFSQVAKHIYRSAPT